jgi:NADPH:quinone reductase-like Zn-dependent oxidoreductase
MRAVLYRDFGPPAALELVDRHATPRRQPGELLVAVHATSVNPIDCKSRRGDIPFPLKQLQAVRPKVCASEACQVVGSNIHWPICTRYAMPTLRHNPMKVLLCRYQAAM